MIKYITNEKDEKEILKQYRGLLRACQCDMNSKERKKIRLAFDIALETIKDKRRVTGELYITHSLEVARMVATEIGLGVSSIISTILHEAIFVDETLIEKTRNIFGDPIPTILEGLKKIYSIGTGKAFEQPENYRKLLLNLASDVRVILIRLAHQLQFMRNMKNMDPQLQLQIAWESFYLIAPLAHRLGLYLVKSELEDLSLRYIEPDVYFNIERKLKETSTARNKFIRDFIKPIKTSLEGKGFDFEIKGRPKSIYSIWNKMKRQNVEFEEIYDLFAIRIILKSEGENEKPDCWRVYSIVTNIYQPNPKRMRDWISVPKSNGYESLHTTVVVPGGKWVEVQIRTERMNEVAEKGVAAHWKYKGQKSDNTIDDFITKIREILESPGTDTDEFIDDFKLSLYSNEIFVFTPKGDLRKFPEDATVLDFAYDIHTNVGDTCTGAKVNGKNVTIRHKLQNGDKVEIFTSKNQVPKREWLEFVVTSKAKGKIKQSLREERLKEADNGREILQRRLRNWKIGFNDENIKKLLSKYRLKTATDLYSLIATEKIDLGEIKVYLSTPDEETKETIEKETKKTPLNDIKDFIDGHKDDYLLIDNKIGRVGFSLAKCCNPVFGDDVFGFVTVGEGIKVHRMTCPNAAQLLSKYNYRVVKAKWTNTEGDTGFQTSIKISGNEEGGTLGKITELISKDIGVNLRSINFNNKNTDFEGTITVLVRNKQYLDAFVERLKKVKGVHAASRSENII
ncbi:MAG: bifunctional (p)ppGpp synthetase/guanosine-3',5'-bis(diphosphate) 3'-pyrophosphohydrolase [Bacteroidales bacterium]|nr:bifunctional (p)ppGpp synthetase/guanosine-3',5'-bis(diphosphate) 3'-pyrophosphohydrolase [Bacteroidales bacterium]